MASVVSVSINLPATHGEMGTTMPTARTTTSEHSIAARKAASLVDIPDGLKYFDSLPDNAFVNSSVVRALYGGITAVSLWRWVKAGRAPAPRKLAGSRLNSWRVGDLRAALAAVVQS